jgi:hypothetical protein
MTTQDTTTVATVPAALPVPGEKLEDVMRRLQAIHPHVVPGKAVEVDRHAVEVRDYANYALEYWKKQLGAANILIQQGLGDAEVGTVNRIPVIKRYQGEVAPEAEPRKGGWRDYLKGVKH